MAEHPMLLGMGPALTKFLRSTTDASNYALETVLDASDEKFILKLVEESPEYFDGIEHVTIWENLGPRVDLHERIASGLKQISDHARECLDKFESELSDVEYKIHLANIAFAHKTLTGREYERLQKWMSGIEDVSVQRAQQSLNSSVVVSLLRTIAMWLCEIAFSKKMYPEFRPGSASALHGPVLKMWDWALSVVIDYHKDRWKVLRKKMATVTSAVDEGGNKLFADGENFVQDFEARLKTHLESTYGVSLDGELTPYEFEVANRPAFTWEYQKVSPPKLADRVKLLIEGLSSTDHNKLSKGFDNDSVKTELRRTATVQPSVRGYGAVAALVKSFRHQIVPRMRALGHDLSKLPTQQGTSFESHLLKEVLCLVDCSEYKSCLQNLLAASKKKRHVCENQYEWDWFAPIQLQVVLNMMSHHFQIPKMELSVVIATFESSDCVAQDDATEVSNELKKLPDRFGHDGPFLVSAVPTTIGLGAASKSSPVWTLWIECDKFLEYHGFTSRRQRDYKGQNYDFMFHTPRPAIKGYNGPILP